MFAGGAPPSLRWIEARNVFFGLNFEEQNLARGLQLAAKCEDEDARLLTSLFPRGPPSDAEHVKTILLTAGQRDVRCLAWAFVFLPRNASLDELWPAARQGYPLAMAWLCTHLTGPESLAMALQAAERGEPSAAEWLSGLATLGDAERQRWCERAAALGNATCLSRLSKQATTLQDRLALQLRAAAYGSIHALSEHVQHYLCQFLEGKFPAASIYEIGKVLDRRMTNGTRGDRLVTPLQQESANRCRAFYHNWARVARDRVMAWLWCAKRLQVHKDVARLIAGLVRRDTIDSDLSQFQDDELGALLFEWSKMPTWWFGGGETFDAIVCFGSDDLSVAVHAASLLSAGVAPVILFSGASGRGTEGLFGGRSEARTFADRAVERGVPREAILLEERATNSGENCVFSCELLRARGIVARRLMVVQKPYMEKRTYATLMKQWPDAQMLERVQLSSPGFSFRRYALQSRSKQSVIEMMVGDVQRMRVYAERGFQIPMPVEDRIWAVYLELVKRGYDKHVLH
jgi:hypothetical protein